MQHGINPNIREGWAERQRRERKQNVMRDEPSEGPKVLKYLDHPHHQYQIKIKPRSTTILRIWEQQGE